MVQTIAFSVLLKNQFRQSLGTLRNGYCILSEL